MNAKRVFSLLTAGALLTATLTACGSGGNEVNNSDSEEESNNADLITVKVGIGNEFTPFCYLDENENLAGYDYEVILAVADLLSDKYEFEFTGDAVANLLIGLDTGAYDIAIHHFGWTAERAENYLYATVPDFYTGEFHLGYLAGRTDIQSLDDLDGKTIATTAGIKSETIILDYLEAHPELNINLAYYDGREELYTGITSGLFDATLASTYDLNTFSSQFDNYLEISDWTAEYEGDTGTYFIYSKGEDELQQDIDAALQTLLDNGTLAELCIKYVGEDYSTLK